jgi:hypothetical protein
MLLTARSSGKETASNVVADRSEPKRLKMEPWAMAPEEMSAGRKLAALTRPPSLMTGVCAEAVAASRARARILRRV